MIVLLADDHTVVRAGLKTLLLEHSAVSKIFEVSNGEEALEMLKNNKIDLCLLDITMPKITGLEVLETAAKLNITTKFLILSMHSEKEFALLAINKGAAGYINKSSIAEELHEAIDRLIEGKKYVSNELAEILLSTRSKKENNLPHLNLSERELEVFIKLAEGKTIHEIGELLFLSAKTVSTYKLRLFEKMNFQSITDLVKYAINNKMIE